MTSRDPAPESVIAAAAAVRACFEAGAPLVIAAGAGMGVDSGLPDFRGPEGFWRAYPPYAHLGLSFEDLANPRWFSSDPTLAWGFYGHRRNLYRATAPHRGFSVLRTWARRSAGHAVFTSNVDGAFTAAGFEDPVVAEVHGSIQWMQCTTGAHGLWPAGPETIPVDEATFRARPPFALCPRCGALARPNILMFGDAAWDDTRSEQQLARLHSFLGGVAPAARLVVIECGAGTNIPTVRRFSEGLLRRFRAATLVRINLREAHVDDRALASRVVSVAAGARASLEAMDAAL